VQFLDTDVQGAWIVDVDPIADERGFFARAFSRDEFAEHGMNTDFVQENIGYNVRAGTLRGLHLQHEPHGEAKLVRCTRGAIWDVAADVHPGSITYGKWVGVELSSENRRMLYVPEGCAHGYLTLVGNTEIRYLTTHEYVPASASGVPYDDPVLGVDWPAEIAVVSEADSSWPPLDGGSSTGESQ
jgi:dTDP-4-dehydrorhamnose 3,5-epimerase